MNRHEMDMCEGPILGKLIRFAIPLMLTYILQVLFNAADVAVVGRFSTTEAVAAVGANGALINLIVGLFAGLSVGANVALARVVGQKNKDRARDIVSTSVVISVLFGIFLAGVGFFFAKDFLALMKCDPTVIDLAAKYMRIYMLGMPIIMLYNFCASILRAVGDTMRPLIFLIISGVVNVGLNIFFVTVLGMDVDGVAIATVSSQLICAILSLITMVRSDGYCHFDFRYMKISGRELAGIVRIGLPSGLQGCVFSISNVLIQSSVNSLGPVTMAGNTVAQQFDGVIYNSMFGIANATVSFVSQNLGANRIDRVRRTVRSSLLLVSIVGVTVSMAIWLLRIPLCSFITKDAAAIDVACRRLKIMCYTYFLCGIMDVMSNSMRGLGKSTLAMVISLFGSCVIRVIWLKTVFLMPKFHFYEMIYVIYPISWLLTFGIAAAIYFPMIHRFERQVKIPESSPASSIPDSTSSDTEMLEM